MFIIKTYRLTQQWLNAIVVLSDIYHLSVDKLHTVMLKLFLEKTAPLFAHFTTISEKIITITSQFCFVFL